jgi:hypothetical protein
MSYGEISRRARVNKRNASLIVKRLICKGFVEPVQAKPRHGMTNTYVVFGYKTVLERFRKLNRLYVVRFGNSVRFVHPVSHDPTDSDTPMAGQSAVLTVPERPGVAATPGEAVHTDVASLPTVVATDDGGDVAATTQLDKVVEARKTDSESTSILSDLFLEFGICLDSPAVKMLVDRCKQNEPTATLEEIAHFTRLKIHQLRGRRNIDNIIGLTIVAVPMYFKEPAIALQIYRRTRAAERARELDFAKTILSDPDADQNSRQWAERILLQNGDA